MGGYLGDLECLEWQWFWKTDVGIKSGRLFQSVTARLGGLGGIERNGVLSLGWDGYIGCILGSLLFSCCRVCYL